MRRSFSLVLGSLTFAWVAGVQFYYAITLDFVRIEAFFQLFTHRSLLQSLVFLSTQFVVVPFGLVVGVSVLWNRIHSPASRGIVGGLAIAMWANATFLVVPYLGAYASFPTAGIVWLLTGGQRAGSTYYLTVLASNAIIYPLFAVLLLLNRERQNPPFACRKCAYDLTGNVSGVCPECGMPVDPTQQFGHHGVNSVSTSPATQRSANDAPP